MAKKNKAKGGKDSLLKLFSNIDWKKYLVASIVVFVVIYLLDILVHGYLLKDLYAKYFRMFLSQKVMMARMPYMLGGQALYALLLVLLYSQGYTGKGSVMEGLRFGIYLGLLISLPCALSSYSWSVYPTALIIKWGVYGFLQTVVYGGVIGATYKK